MEFLKSQNMRKRFAHTAGSLCRAASVTIRTP